MRSKNQPPMMRGNPDNFQSPEECINCLIPFLNKEWVIWECACGKGNLIKAFKKNGFKILGTDINDKDLAIKIDFLNNSSYAWEIDCIITNPPFSKKWEFIKKCYEIGKPFALLLLLTTLESEERQKLFRDYGIQIIIPNKRFSFETPNGKNGSPWFATAWFTWGLNLPKDLLFIDTKRLNKLSGGQKTLI